MCIYFPYSHVISKYIQGYDLSKWGGPESASLMDYPIVYDVACIVDQVA